MYYGNLSRQYILVNILNLFYVVNEGKETLNYIKQI